MTAIPKIQKKKCKSTLPTNGMNIKVLPDIYSAPRYASINRIWAMDFCVIVSPKLRFFTTLM